MTSILIPSRRGRAYSRRPGSPLREPQIRGGASTLCPGVMMLLLLWLSSACAAQVQLQVHRGWGGKERNGRWNPLIVRASEPIPQNVILDWRWAVAGEFQAHIFQQTAIAPAPQSFELIAPLHYNSASSVLVITGTTDGRTIGQSPTHLRLSSDPASEVGPQAILIGISGKWSLLEDVELSGAAGTAYLPPRFLPRTAMGYDCLDVLLLDQPDLREIDPDQQRAIADWIAGGGTMILCPSDSPIPQDSPLAKALPCRIGPASSFDLPENIVKDAGLRPVPARISGWELLPGPAAQSLDILPGSHVNGVVGGHGLGEVLVTPIDLTSFRFDPTTLKTKAGAFWRPILSSLGQADRPDPKRAYEAPFYGYSSESDDQQREGAATAALCEFLGPEPARRPDLPIVAVGMLLVLGPLDSILLYALGRRHWTWTTVPGWLGLLLAGGYSAGSALRHRQPDVASATIIDQVDDQVVAQTQLIGLSASSETDFSLPQARGWWQPAIPHVTVSGQFHPQLDLHFHQSQNGTFPESVEVDAGQSRFLRGDSPQSSPPVLGVSLKLIDHRLVGTIKNLCPSALKEMRIRTQYGVVKVPLGIDGMLASGKTISLDLPASGEPFSLEWISRQFQKVEYASSQSKGHRLQESDLWSVAPDLGGRRSIRIDMLINNKPDFACIYVESVDPPGFAVQANTKPRERYYQWIRAIVSLH